ncbi:MAG: hypothetical protein HY815_11805, partial [Candidatus Riflebacteria bacterium]|nr:hypothetical protein [Candidatus Riflebacteria bacterium]
QVLKLAYPAIKAADPKAQVMLNALLLWDIFQGQGESTDEEIQSRLENPPGGKRKDLTDLFVLLDAHQYFDIIDVHSLGDYNEIAPTVHWLRRQMAKRKVYKPITIGDAFPMSPLLAYGMETCRTGPLTAKEVFPVTRETRCAAAEVIARLRKKDPVAHAWLEAEIAKGLVKKMVVAAAENVNGINIGNMEDWPIPFGAGVSQFMGLVDVDRSLGDQLHVVRTARGLRPGFHALRMVIQKLDGYQQVLPVPVDKRPGFHLYRFLRVPRATLVGWYDDGRFHSPGEDAPTIEVLVPWSKADATCTEIPTKRDQTNGGVEVLAVQDGKIGLRLGSVPVFVE